MASVPSFAPRVRRRLVPAVVRPPVAPAGPPVLLALDDADLPPLRGVRLHVRPGEVALALACGRDAERAAAAFLDLASGRRLATAGRVRWPLAPPPLVPLAAEALRPRLRERRPPADAPLLVVCAARDPGGALAPLLREAAGGRGIVAAARIDALEPAVAHLTLTATLLLRAFLPPGAAAPSLSLLALGAGRLSPLVRVGRTSRPVADADERTGGAPTRRVVPRSGPS